MHHGSSSKVVTCWNESRGRQHHGNSLRVRAGETMATGRTQSTIQNLRGASKRAGEGLLMRTCNGRTKENDLELKEGSLD